MRSSKNRNKYWRKFAKLRNTEGEKCVGKEAFALHQSAITSLQHVPVAQFTHDDWRNLASYQDNAGYECEGEQAYALHQSAINSIKHIPDELSTLDDWHNLAL